ncbi:MAG: sugar-binding protein [Candidatus Latescibacterota bacterium]|nr:sugar-binding protein [Candidatus Latescibacterota bacterium]
MSILIATCALAGLCSLPLQAHDSEPLASPFVGATPVLDGDLSEWESFAFLEVTSENGVFDSESGSSDGPDDLRFSFAVANDHRYLYVAMRIVDDVLVLDTNPDPTELHTRAWMDDAVEIFIDGNHNHAPNARDRAQVEFQTGGEFSVVANGAVTSDQSGVAGRGSDPEAWTSSGSYGAEGAAYAAPWDTSVGGFQIEARFNYKIMGEGIGPGSRIGFTVSAHDDDNGGDRDTALYWKGVGRSSWRDEGGWGDLILGQAATVIEDSTLGELKSGALKDGNK